MRTLLAAGLLVPALAAGTAEARPCQLSIVRAPDEVRQVVQDFVSAEPGCSAALEVRIVETNGGFYIFARDDQGHTRDRVVPDAQTVAVLIASWMADDGTASAPVAAPAAAAPTPVFAPRERSTPDSPPRAPDVRSDRTWQLGLLFGGEDDNNHRIPFGGRIELDVTRYAGWNFGGALTVEHVAAPVFRALDTGDIDWYHAALTAYVARSVPLGPIALRGTLGAGLVGTYMKGVLYDDQAPIGEAYAWPKAFGVYPTAEASLDVRVAGVDHWQLEIGPYVHVLAESFALDMPASGRIPSRGVEAMFHAALRWQR